MVIHSQSQISSDLSDRIILSDESKKLSQLAQLSSLLSSDFFTVERHYPKEIQFEILREELSDSLGQLIILLEDNWISGQAETYQYLINEMKITLDNIRYRDSYNIDYGTASRLIIGSLSDEYSFGSMAYKDKWEYARSWHIHDYSWSNLKPTYSTSAIAEFTFSDSKSTRALSLCLPEFKQPEYKIADIGEYRFLATTNRRQILTSSQDFDGWVYADGSRYLCADFPEAYEVFNPTHDTPSYGVFEVPLISDFVQFVSFQEHDTNSFGKVQYQNAMHEHTHDKIDSSQFANYQHSTNVDVNLCVLYGTSASKSANALHTGYRDKKCKLENLSVVINSNNLQSLPTSTRPINKDIESKPAYIKLPLVVYIGKKAVK